MMEQATIKRAKDIIDSIEKLGRGQSCIYYIDTSGWVSRHPDKFALEEWFARTIKYGEFDFSQRKLGPSKEWAAASVYEYHARRRWKASPARQD